MGVPSPKAHTIEFVGSRQVYTEQTINNQGAEGRKPPAWRPRRKGLGRRVASQPASHSLHDQVGTTLLSATYFKTTTAWRTQNRFSAT